MSIFDQYSLLDPAKMLREIDAETDGETFDNYSLLDLNRARAQLAAAGIEVSNAAMLDPSLFKSELDVALDTGGGGGGPVWLPEGATTFADFVNGHYWDGSAETTAAAMFKSDDIDADPFEPTRILNGTGYYTPDTSESAGSYQGAALVAIGAEFVFLVELNFVGVVSGTFTTIAYDGTYDGNYNTAIVGSVAHMGDNVPVTTPNTQATVDGINRAAFRFSNAKLSACLNGGTVQSAVDPHAPDPISILTFWTHDPNCIIRSVTTYPNSTLDAALPALTAIS